MASHRIERTTEDIKRELTAIFRELKDPRVTGAFLSIVRVEVTNDLSYCTVKAALSRACPAPRKPLRGLSPPRALSAASLAIGLSSGMFPS